QDADRRPGKGGARDGPANAPVVLKDEGILFPDNAETEFKHQ
ncbi:hypothetical protein YPPY55_3325, partial [Yersinia pestis PY-55]